MLIFTIKKADFGRLFKDNIEPDKSWFSSDWFLNGIQVNDDFLCE